VHNPARSPFTRPAFFQNANALTDSVAAAGPLPHLPLNHFAGAIDPIEV